jgi:hypothetical protein
LNPELQQWKVSFHHLFYPFFYQYLAPLEE